MDAKIMDKQSMEALLKLQKNFFASGATMDVNYRKEALKRLKKALDVYEVKMESALLADMGKSTFESYLTELGPVKNELSYMLRHIDSFAKTKHVRANPGRLLSLSMQKPVPYGTVLIIAPWNCPLLLTLEPLIDAVAAGNTVIVKPSSVSPSTSNVLQDVIRDSFPPELVSVVEGSREENDALLDLDVDFIFFAGRKENGREVMRRAAEHIIPLALELNGKNPCIVDRSANIRAAARRIVFGKFINCGQVSASPDYILADAFIKEELIADIKLEIRAQFGKEPIYSPDYGRIINKYHYDRLIGLIDHKKVVFGGECDPEKNRIAPTIMDHVTFDDPCMQDEIFGPILPVLTYTGVNDAIEKAKRTPDPLALYIFAKDSAFISKVIDRVPYGGGCVNDTMAQISNPMLSLSGIGESGMGAYHGRYGFETFTHYKNIVDKARFADLSLRYAPANPLKMAVQKILIR